MLSNSLGVWRKPNKNNQGNERRTRGQWPYRPAATRALKDNLGIHMHIASNSNSGGLWGHSSLMIASMASEVKLDFRFGISNLNFPQIHVHIAFNRHFGGLGGYGGLQMTSMASEVKFDFWFKISNLNYPGIHVHNASNSHDGLQTASEVAKGLGIELSDLNNPCWQAFLACKSFLS